MKAWLDFEERKEGKRRGATAQRPYYRTTCSCLVLHSIYPQRIADNISRIYISKQPGHCRRDSMIWTGTKAGIFSAKSAYRLLARNSWAESSLQQSYRPLWHLIWKTNGVSPRVRMFIWRSVNRALAVRGTLGKYIRDIPPLCSHDEESVEHLLLACPFARGVWFACPLSLRIDSSPPSLGSWILDIANSLNDSSSLALCFFTMWSIWKTRKELIFRQAAANGLSTVARAVQLHSDSAAASPLGLQPPSVGPAAS